MLRHILFPFTIFLLITTGYSKSWVPEGWTPEKWFRENRSPRTANYDIQVVLNWPEKSLSGSERIHWRNTGTKATNEFPMHLYMNAFRGPQTCFIREGGLKGCPKANDPKDWGYCKLNWVSLDGQLLSGHPGEDDSVYWVKLPRMVQPGETIHIEVNWQTRFPRLGTRSGFAGHFLMAAQWYPKAGVYTGENWNCHAYHRNTNFYSDFGIYNVEISMPKMLLPAFTGTCLTNQGPSNQELDAHQDPKIEINCIYKIHAEDVHDFALAVMPKLCWSYKKFEYRGIQIFYFYQPENLNSLLSQHEAIKAALRTSAELLFPYPYPVPNSC